MQIILPCIQEVTENLISEVCLYQQSGDHPKIEFYAKRKLLGIFWKPELKNDEHKINLINEIFVSIKAIRELGNLPEKLSVSLKNEFLIATEESRKKVISLLLTD
jgi:hypothetical protein